MGEERSQTGEEERAQISHNLEQEKEAWHLGYPTQARGTHEDVFADMRMRQGITSCSLVQDGRNGEKVGRIGMIQTNGGKNG